MASFTWIMSSASSWLALLGESSARAAVLLGVAWAACFVLRRRSATARHLIWALSLAALVAAPVSLDLAPKLRIPAWWRPAVHSAIVNEDYQRPEPAAQPAAANRPNEVAVVGLALVSEAPAFAAAAPRDLPPSSSLPSGSLLPALLLAGWALGFIVLLARLVIGHIRVRKMARGATILDEATLDETVPGASAGLAGRFETARAVRFLQSTGETMPMTWGWRKPVVLLPASFGKWGRERRTMTICHELAHIGRADWLTQTLAHVVRAIYWFHPLVWLALGRVRIEADRACDDMVLRAGVKPSGYAGHLVQAAREFRTAGLRPWVAIAMAHPSSLNHRVRYVLDEKVVRSGLGRRRGAALAVGIALIVIAVPSIEAVGQTEAAPTEPQVEVELAAPQVTPIPDLAATTVEQEVAAVAPDLILLAQAEKPAPQVQLWKDVKRGRGPAKLVRLRAGQAKLAAQLHALEDKAKIEGLKQPRLSPQALQTASAALRKALGSSDANVRAEAAEALGSLGSPEQANLEALGKALSDSEPRVQRNAVESLGRLLRLNKEMPPDDAVRWLTPALNAPDASVRREAAGALGRLRGTAAINAATKLVGDADPHVQREAIEALGRLLRSSDAQAARSALPVLQKALQHDNPDVRRQLVETLGSLHSIADEVVPLLAQAAEDPDPNVQREAVEALGRISSRGSLHEEWIGDFVENEINEFQWEGMEDAKRALVEIQVDNEENLEAPTKTQP
jgi:beta-lactamase regulating signal transducer with metallopeptidase domain/HEAT repeat protein